MADLTLSGIERTDFTTYHEKLEELWRAAFGEELSTEPDTPQGQIIGGNALTLSELDEVLVDLAASLDIFQATGSQLDSLCSILGIFRNLGVKSNVNAVLTGTPSATIPTGSQASLTSGEIFILKEAVTLDSSGTGSGFFEAQEEGTIPVPANSLTQIVTPSPGWETVNNPIAGTPGTLEETDDEFRRRYFLELALNAVTPLDSIVSKVFELEGVTDVSGAENDTNSNLTVKGVTLPPHSVAIVVSGGADSEVADTIQSRKSLGCSTFGDTTVSVPVYIPNKDDPVQDIDISFFRTEAVGLNIFIKLDTDERFPGDGITQITNNIIAYFNGSINLPPGTFESDGLRIGENVLKSRLYTPINMVQGHQILELVITKEAEEWDAGVSYDSGDRVRGSDGATYYSLIDGNLGNNPVSSPTEWSQEPGAEIFEINLNQQGTTDESRISIDLL